METWKKNIREHKNASMNRSGVWFLKRRWLGLPAGTEPGAKKSIIAPNPANNQIGHLLLNTDH